MKQGVLSYKNSDICYYRFGNGPDLTICFHGYGEEGKLYSFLEKCAGDDYSFFCIDLPFHGKTQWNEGLIFTAQDLAQIVRVIFKQELTQPPIAAQPEPYYSIIGFSLGGRVGLSLYEANPGNVKKIILLAPDGLRVNPWYWFATQTWPGDKIFAFSMKHPGWFLGFLKFVNRLGLVNASVFKFVNYYIGNKEARQLLYQRWTTLRKLTPDLPRIKTLILHYKTATRLVYGKYDRIILPARGQRFKKGIEEFCTLTVIDSGHQVVHPNHATQILSALLH